MVLGVENTEKIILGAKINESWNKMAKELRRVKAIDDEAVFIGDVEKEMRYTLTTDGRLYQLDLVHAASITGYKLWEDRVMSLEERKIVVGRLVGYHKAFESPI